MISILCILSASALITAAFLLGQALGARALGARIEEVSFFFGRIFSVQVAGVRFSLGYFPTGGSVKFSDDFQDFHPLRKIAIACCGLLAHAIVALVCLGAEGALHHVVRGYGQLLSGALSPLQTGARLVDALALVFQNDSYFGGLGILAAKFLALNSLPIGVFSGGFIVLWLLEMAGLRSEKFSASFQLVGLVLLLLLYASWAVALIAALAR